MYYDMDGWLGLCGMKAGEAMGLFTSSLVQCRSRYWLEVSGVVLLILIRVDGMLSNQVSSRSKQFKMLYK